MKKKILMSVFAIIAFFAVVGVVRACFPVDNCESNQCGQVSPSPSASLPVEEATPSPDPSSTPAPQETPAPPVENHAGEGDGKGCATHACYDGYKASAPQPSSYPNSQYDGAKVGWK